MLQCSFCLFPRFTFNITITCLLDLFLFMLNIFLTPCILTVISDSQSEGLLQMNRGEISKES